MTFRPSLLLCLVLLLGVSVLPTVGETQKRKKKPVPEESDDATPRPTRKKAATPEPEPTPKAKKPKSETSVDGDEATPRPTRKKATTSESEPTPSAKKSKSAAAADSDDTTPRPTGKRNITPEPTPSLRKSKAGTSRDEDEATPRPRKQSSPAPEPTPEAKKPRVTPEEAIKSPTKAEGSPAPSAVSKYAPNATLDPSELAEFSSQAPKMQALITAALGLTKQNLTYTYGSSDPASGGMDCSGTIYYLLRSVGVAEVPRDSSSQYAWVRKAGGFRAVVSRDAKSFEFGELRPGDLMFWTGTYDVQREIPVSHVMLYLGTERKTKRRVMFGASDGRSYAGVQRWGVSVFDFVMPRIDPANPEKAHATFIGYGPIPGISDSAAVAAREPEPEAPQESVTTKSKSTAKDPDESEANPQRKATPRPKRKKS